MSTGDTTRIEWSRGHVNSGSGPQFNDAVYMTIVAAGLSAESKRRKRSGPWSEEHFTWLSDRFQTPPGFRGARMALDAHKVVLLAGPAGSGRRTAAMILLKRTEHGGGQFSELIVSDLVGDESADPLEDLDIETGDRLLLDLTTAEPDQLRTLMAHLHPFFARVEEQRARSVVILPDGYEVETDFRRLIVRLERPDAARAYRLHLQAEGFISDREAEPPDLLRFLDVAPMRDVARLIELLVQARATHPSGGYPLWCATGLKALTEGSNAVADAVRNLQQGSERALLFSAAMFCGGPVDAAFHAANHFLHVSKYPEQEQHQLDAADLHHRLAEMGVSVDPERRIVFKEPIDGAVRAYFWDNYPNLRKELVPWLRNVVAMPRVAAEEKDLLVRRFAEQSLRTGECESMRELITAWSGDSAAAVARHATVLLDEGLEDQRHGGWFRDQIYAWSTQGSLPRGLGAVLIGACSRTLAASHPDHAVIRLRHLARKDGAVGVEARRVLAQMVGARRRLLRFLVLRIAKYGDVRDARLFIAIADPYHLTDSGPRALVLQPAVRTGLAATWSWVLREPQQEVWEERARDWMQTCAESPRRRVLLDVLVEGASGDFDNLTRLLAVGTSWAREGGTGTDRSAIAQLLFARITSAQGITFSNFPSFS